MATFIKYFLTILMVLLFNNFKLEPIKEDLKDSKLTEFSFSLNEDFKSFTIDKAYTKDISSIESIIIPESFLGLPVKRINKNAFEGYTSLKDVYIPDSVETIDDFAFLNCESLETIILPDSITTIGRYAFYDCKKLQSINLPSGISKVNEGAFAGCISLDNVILPETLEEISPHCFENCASLNSLTIQQGTKKIKNYAFSNCQSLLSIVIPNSVSSVEPLAFNQSYQLFEIYNLSNVDLYKTVAFSIKPVFIKTSKSVPTSLIIKDGFIFSNTDGYELLGSLNNDVNLVLPKYDFNYDIHSNAFYKNSNLISINIPDSIVNIGANAFYECGNVESISLGNDIVSIGEGAFSGINKIRTLEFKEGVSDIADRAFSNCYNLISITMPSTLINIGRNAFKDCYKLIEIYNLSTFDVTSVIKTSLNVYNDKSAISKISYRGDFTFYEYNDELYLIDGKIKDKKLILPYSDSNYKIYNYAFYSVDNMDTLFVPMCVTQFGKQAFSLTNGLRFIDYEGTKAQWKELLKSSPDNLFSNRLLSKMRYNVKGFY